ncbi:hypothetical protein [Methanolobus profundi]|nr:hypothetical protein [Methanolobus profundi]
MIKNRIFALAIKILIICIMMIGTASANPPIVLEGSVTIDGSPAPAGTEVKAMYGESVVGATTVDNAGLYSDTRDNRLGVPYGYETITLFVNNIQAQVLDLSDANAGDILEVDLRATSVTSSSPSTTKKTSSGGGGFSAPAVEETTTEVVEDIPIEEEEETMASVADVPAEETPVEVVEEEVSQSADFPTIVGIGSMLAAAGILMRRKAKIE